MWTNMDFTECYPESCSSVSLAARNGHSSDMRSLILNNNAIDGQDNRGWRPLHEAAFNNHVTCVQYLLEHDACDVNWETFEGETSLILAARAGHVDVIHALVKAEADVGLCSKADSTALHEAVTGNHDACTSALLDTAINIDAKNFAGDSALKIAAENGYDTILSSLISHGARLDVTDDNNINAMFAASHKGHYSCLEALIAEAKKRGEMNLLDTPASDGGTAVFLAAQEGHTDCLRLLLDNGASANIMTKDPASLALCAAIEFQHIECIELLVPEDVTNRQLFDTCDTHPLTLAASDIHDDTPDCHKIMRLLINHGIEHLSFHDSLPPGAIGAITKVKEYYRWPYCYKDSKLHVTTHPDTCFQVRNIQFTYSQLMPLTKECVPSLLIALGNGLSSDEDDLICHLFPIINYYRKNIVGNVTFLEAFDYIVWQVHNFGLQIAILDNSRDLGYLILSGTDVNSCLNISSDPLDRRYSILNVMRDTPPLEGAPITAYKWLSFVILPHCGFVHLNDSWKGHMSEDEWAQIKKTEVEKQSLLSLCRRKIFFHLVKTNRFDRLDELGLPGELKAYLIADKAMRFVRRPIPRPDGSIPEPLADFPYPMGY